MALSKIQSESMNLADTFAFTGTVTGAGGLVHLQTTEATGSASITFNSSVMDVTKYERYVFYGNFLPVGDGTDLSFRFLDSGGTAISTSNAYETFLEGGSLTNRTFGQICGNTGSVADNEIGCIFQSFLDFKQRGAADICASLTSITFRTNSNTVGAVVQSGSFLDPSVVTTQPTGITFFCADGGNFARCKIGVFGVLGSA